LFSPNAPRPAALTVTAMASGTRALEKKQV
jgi:hypothetical protein